MREPSFPRKHRIEMRGCGRLHYRGQLFEPEGPGRLWAFRRGFYQPLPHTLRFIPPIPHSRSRSSFICSVPPPRPLVHNVIFFCFNSVLMVAYSRFSSALVTGDWGRRHLAAGPDRDRRVRPHRPGQRALHRQLPPRRGLDPAAGSGPRALGGASGRKHLGNSGA